MKSSSLINYLFKCNIIMVPPDSTLPTQRGCSQDFERGGGQISMII